MAKSRFGYLLYRWHAWVGLFSGAFLVIICVTGSVAVFRPEIERAVDWGGYDFNVVPVGEPISLERAIEIARAKYPGGVVTAANLPALPGSWQSHGPAYSVTVNAGRGVGNRHVLIDPYRAAVVAEMRPNSGWGNWLRQLHIRFLYFSFWGRYIVGLFGIALLFVTVSGLFIFARFNANTWRPKIRRGRGPRIFLADLHKVTGLSSVAFNVVFGLTGAVLGLEGVYHKWIAAPEKAPRRAAVAQLAPGRLQGFIHRAAELVPGARPAGADLSLRNGTVRVRLQHATAALIREGENSVLFDAASGDVIQVKDARRATAAARFYFAMEPLHFGRLGGAMWVKLLWGAMGLTGGALSITGFAIYVLRKRKPKRASAPEAAAPDAGVADAGAAGDLDELVAGAAGGSSSPTCSV